MDKDNKYRTFRNLLFNELGITKEDIKLWVKEAVYEVAETYVKDQLSKVDFEKRVAAVIAPTYDNSLRNRIAQLLVEKIEIRTTK